MTDEAVLSREEPLRMGRGWGGGELDERAWHRQRCAALESPALVART